MESDFNQDNDNLREDEESDRPTLGQRIAGAMQPSYMPSTATVPPNAEPAPPQPEPVLDMSKMPGVVQNVTGYAGDPPPVKMPALDMSKLPVYVQPKEAITPATIPSPPTGSNNPNLAALAKKQADLSTPINPRDPATGKTLPKYRMGFGERFLAALADFGQGFGGHGGTPIFFGPGATNQRYDRDEAQRKGELEGVNTQIGTQEKLDATNNKLYELALRQAYDTQRGEAQQETAAAREESAKNRGLYEQAQGELAKARANALNNKPDSPADQRAADADKYGLTGEAKRDFILTGKLPRDMMGATRQPTEFEEWKAAFRRDNGREPTADEIASRKSNRAMKADQIEKDKDTALQKAEAKAQARLDKLRDPRMMFDPTDRRPLAVRKQAVYDDLEKEKAQIQKDYEARAAANANGGRPNLQAGSTKPSGPAKIDPNNLPKTIQVRQKDGTLKTRKVAGYNKETGKLQLVPEGQ